MTAVGAGHHIEDGGGPYGGGGSNVIGNNVDEPDDPCDGYVRFWKALKTQCLEQREKQDEAVGEKCALY
jgi:hypothetical protein